MVSPATVAALAVMLGAASWCDVRTHRIPNAIVLAGVASAVGIAVLPGGIGLGAAAGGLAIAFGLAFPLYLLRVLGAGDVKLIAAVGAFLGCPAAFGATLAIFVAGGALALGWAAARSGVRAVLQNLRTGLCVGLGQIITGSLPRAGDFPVTPGRMPYALAITAGTAVYFVVRGKGAGVLGL